MRTLAVAAALLGLVATWGVASAEIGTADNVPAATLLLPYFEVDYGNGDGITTLLSINNASASASIAHVTLWTDQGIPTLTFDIYLTGFDVQTINLRDIFNGILPLTADAGADPNDTISNQGLLSQDINFPPSGPPNPPVGPCNTETLYTSPIPAATVDGLRRAHTGQSSSLFGNLCGGANYGDTIARGYATVDDVTQCNLLNPTTPGYFTATATFRNLLWGDYVHVDPGNNFASGDALVHIESCVPGDGYRGYVGNGAGQCPLAAGDYTFYGRYVPPGSALDQREPLATTFATRYANGGAFNGGTDLLVWRDTKVSATAVDGGPYACGGPGPAGWFPLAQTDVVSFDEEENPTDQCAGPALSPVTGQMTCFPLATQRIHTHGGNLIARDMVIPSNFGWLFLNLNHQLVNDPFPARAQAWVSTVMDAEGRFSVGFPAIQLDNALNLGPASGQVLIP
jgi:hypothetical protein